ncbi:hypothetical protein BGZ83_001962, partial [Gryganskiella cystojenkinii]
GLLDKKAANPQSLSRPDKNHLNRCHTHSRISLKNTRVNVGLIFERTPDHDMRYICTCQSTFSTRDGLVRHYKQHCRQGPVEPNINGITLADVTQLIEDELVLIGTAEDAYNGDEVGEDFNVQGSRRVVEVLGASMVPEQYVRALGALDRSIQNAIESSENRMLSRMTELIMQQNNPRRHDLILHVAPIQPQNNQPRNDLIPFIAPNPPQDDLVLFVAPNLPQNDPPAPPSAQINPPQIEPPQDNPPPQFGPPQNNIQQIDPPDDAPLTRKRARVPDENPYIPVPTRARDIPAYHKMKQQPKIDTFLK